MKAWRVYDVKDIRLDEIPRPVVKPGCVVLRTRVIQLSVTEIQLFFLGDYRPGSKWEGLREAKEPLIMFGHEFCAEVVEVGEGVDEFQVGERVFHGRNMACGRCAACIAGQGIYCRKGPVLGTRNVPGLLAEYGVVPAGLLVKVPDSITDSEAAAMQPLMAAVDAVVEAEIKIGDVAAVFGQGVMGLECAQLLRYCGASKIIGVDIRAEPLSLSRQLGVDVAVNASEVDPAEAIRAATGGLGADVVFECAGGSPQFGLAGMAAFTAATKAVRDGGKAILASLYEAGTALEHRPLRRGIQYRGFRNSSPSETAWFVGLVASHRVQLAPMITHILDGIESVPEAIEMTANKQKSGVISPVQVRFI